MSVGGGCGRLWVEDVGVCKWRMWMSVGGGCGCLWVEIVDNRLLIAGMLGVEQNKYRQIN